MKKNVTEIANNGEIMRVTKEDFIALGTTVLLSS